MFLRECWLGSFVFFWESDPDQQCQGTLYSCDFSGGGGGGSGYPAPPLDPRMNGVDIVVFPKKKNSRGEHPAALKLPPPALIFILI